MRPTSLSRLYMPPLAGLRVLAGVVEGGDLTRTRVGSNASRKYVSAPVDSPAYAGGKSLSSAILDTSFACINRLRPQASTSRAIVGVYL